VDLFFPNEIEAMSISGRSSVQDALEELTKGHDALVVITTGRHGAIAKRGKQVWSHPAFDLPGTAPTISPYPCVVSPIRNNQSRTQQVLAIALPAYFWHSILKSRMWKGRFPWHQLLEPW